jgi:hypothetical protein
LSVIDIHVRGFKTDRSIVAERIRNPTIGTRLREAFGLSYTGSSTLGYPGIGSASVEKVGSFNQPEVEAEKMKGKISVVVHVCVEAYFSHNRNLII